MVRATWVYEQCRPSRRKASRIRIRTIFLGTKIPVTSVLFVFDVFLLLPFGKQTWIWKINHL